MDKKILKERLEDVKKQLRTNAKDVHFFDKLIDEALSLKGQMGVEPTELDCGKKEDEFKGNTYSIVLTNKGALYHEYGGYNIFVSSAYTSLYDTLADIVLNKDLYEKAEGEDKERLETTLSAIGYCLSLPKFVFSDADFTFEIATRVVGFIKKQYNELMNKPLQEEDAQKDEQFKEAVLAVEELNNIVKEAK